MYALGIRIVSYWNKKAALWISGRKNFFENLPSSFGNDNQKRIWMHCASLGEFEQGRPVLKKIIEAYPGINIIITFFSPSGYEIIKKSKEFTNVFYLPADSASNAKKLIAIFKPSLVLWVKYEYWYFYLKEIQHQNIPLLMISGMYEKSQPFFKWYGNFYKKMLDSFTHFFVQNVSSQQLLQKLVASQKITISGDTRCDRVISIAENFTEVDGIASFCNGNKSIVCGSTWEDDEAEWIHFVKTHPEIKFIIAPHEIDKENLDDVKKQFSGALFYSEWIQRLQHNSYAINDSTCNCLIVDNIGMLSRLYYYASVTYVGGGFGYKGLHNILEAAVYGKPVIFGPEYEKNFEAEELIDCGGGISIENALELEKIVNELLNDQEMLSAKGKAAKNYVYKNAGASQKIISFIQENRLLTS